MRRWTWVIAIALIATIGPAVFAQTTEPPRLDATSHPKFVNPLPIPARIDLTDPSYCDSRPDDTRLWPAFRASRVDPQTVLRAD